MSDVTEEAVDASIALLSPRSPRDEPGLHVSPRVQQLQEQVAQEFARDDHVVADKAADDHHLAGAG